MNIIRKIFSPSCLGISLLLLFYTFYKSEIYWNGTKSNYYIIYYIIFIVLTFFSIITFYLNNKIKDYLIISLLSIIITLYLFEGYLYLIKENKKEQSQNIFLKKQLYEKETGNKYDERSKFEIYKDLKKIDKNIQLSVYPITFLNEQHKIYPLSGIANSKTIHCNESGYYSIYESDRHGFNNPDSEWDQNEIEYLLVGDSFTQGACVNRPHDIASVLRILSKRPVLNLGYSSNGSLSMYATLREYLNSNVKKVLWVFYDNDIGELESELTLNKQLKNYINDLTFTQNLKLSQKKIDHMGITKIEKLLNWKKKNNEQSIVYHIKLNNVRSIINRFLPKKNQPHPKNELQPKTIKVFKKILKMAKDLTLKNNSQLYFVYLPSYYRYSKELNYSSHYLPVKKIVKELDIPFIDIQEFFDKEQNPLKLFPFESFGHYNVEGYRKVAETIFRFTKN